MGQEHFNFLGHVYRPGGKLAADPLERLFLLLHKVAGRLAGHGLDAARAGGDGHFGDDLDQADLAGGGDVRAAAELAAVAADVHHPDDFPVLLAEEGEGIGRLLVELDLGGLDLGVVEDLAVDEALDLAELVRPHLFEMGEIETQPGLGLRRAGLADMGAQHLAQRPVKEMRGGVVARDGAAVQRRDRKRGGLTDDIDLGKVEGAGGGEPVEMAPGVILDRVDNRDGYPANLGHAVIAGLPAHLGVERRLVEDEERVLAGLDDVDDLGLGRELGEAEELGRLLFGRFLTFGGCHDDLLFLCGPAACTLFLHLRVKTVDVDRQAALRSQQLRHIERKAVGVVELKGIFPTENGHITDRLVIGRTCNSATRLGKSLRYWNAILDHSFKNE